MANRQVHEADLFNNLTDTELHETIARLNDAARLRQQRPPESQAIPQATPVPSTTFPFPFQVHPSQPTPSPIPTPLSQYPPPIQPYAGHSLPAYAGQTVANQQNAQGQLPFGHVNQFVNSHTSGVPPDHGGISPAMARMPGMIGRGQQPGGLDAAMNVNHQRMASAARFRTDRGAGTQRGRRQQQEGQPYAGQTTTTTRRTRGPAAPTPVLPNSAMAVTRPLEAAPESYKVVFAFHHLVCHLPC